MSNPIVWKQHTSQGIESCTGQYMTGKVGGLELRVKPQSDGAFYWDVNDGTNLIRFGKGKDRIHAVELAERVIIDMTRPQETRRMTKWELFSLLGTNGTPTLYLDNGKPGIVQSVQRESGSGRSFIVTLGIEYGLTTTMYVRTND